MKKSAAFLVLMSSFYAIIAFGDESGIANISSDITFFDANYACPQGTHIPTVREFASFAQSKGAKGILELSQVAQGAIPSGYTKISVFNQDGFKDEFYYNPSGFLNKWNGIFWTSSSDLTSGRVQSRINGFNSYYGFIGSNVLDYAFNGIVHNSLECFSGPQKAYVNSGDSLGSDKVLRGFDGNLRYMTQFYAQAACPAGTHLPTVRELAKEAQSNGAKGILELAEVTNGKVPEGYNQISAVNPDGETDIFYFNGRGYKASQGDSLAGGFWTSSTYPGYPNSGYFFSADQLNGAFLNSLDARNNLEAVRCLSSQ